MLFKVQFCSSLLLSANTKICPDFLLRIALFTYATCSICSIYVEVEEKKYLCVLLDNRLD